MKHKLQCHKCRKSFRNTIMYKGQLYCSFCYVQVTHRIKPYFYEGKTLEQALKKTYYVRGYRHNKKGSFYAHLPLPKIMIGHKIKIYLADDDKTRT